MKKLKKLLWVGLLSLIIVGCGANSNESTGISGKVTLDGSTSMEKFVTALSEAMKEEYPDLNLEAQFTGSGSGIQSVIAGTTDIGNSSRELKDEEKAKGAVENRVAIDGIAVITNPSNSVSNVTTEQLVKIYTGEIKNWKELGGKDEQIVVIGREASSGTRGAFESILDIEEKCKYAQEINSTGAVVAAVKSTKGAIGYVSLENAKSDVKLLQVDGVTISESTIKDGTYSLQRPFIMATKGPISEQSEEVKAIFEFLQSEKGKLLIQKVGLVAID